MKILMLTDWRDRGGAAIAAQRLATALEHEGHEVHWATARTERYALNVHNYTDGSLTSLAMLKLAGRLGNGAGRAAQRRHNVQRVHQIIERIKPDVINVHNIHDADLPATLPMELSRRTPVVWTLHDMWAFTATCVYSYDCTGYVTGCTTACPQSGKAPAMPAAKVPFAFDERRQALRLAGQIAFATPSRWLAVQAQLGMLHDHNVTAIPNSLDLDVFRPIDRAAARASLGIPDDAPVLLSAAMSLRDERKGAKYLLDAMKLLPQEKVTWVTLGSGDAPTLPARVRHHVIGPARDERLLAQVYSAADVHVLPTLADNLPNVLLEAAACGTPSVAFHTGGVPEVVVNDLTGWTTPVGDSAALARAIEHAIDMGQRDETNVRQSCRAYAESRYGGRTQAFSYLKLFHSLLERQSRRRAA
jgi:glycosyltransferase involved in cell wall biosynthesis